MSDHKGRYYGVAVEGSTPYEYFKKAYSARRFIELHFYQDHDKNTVACIYRSGRLYGKYHYDDKLKKVVGVRVE